jgi:hypothetical protein
MVTSITFRRRFELGQIRKFGRPTGRSALPSRTDIIRLAYQVRKVPKADVIKRPAKRGGLSYGDSDCYGEDDQPRKYAYPSGRIRVAEQCAVGQPQGSYAKVLSTLPRLSVIRVIDPN